MKNDSLKPLLTGNQTMKIFTPMNTISQTMKNHAKPIFHGFLLVLSLVIFSNPLFGAVNPETLTVTIDSVEEFPKEGHVVSLESPIPLYATFLGSKLKITRSLFYDGKKTPAVSWLEQGQILKEISGYGESSASPVTASATTTALGAEPLKARAKNSDGSLTDKDENAILITTLDELKVTVKSWGDQIDRNIEKKDNDSADETPVAKTLYVPVIKNGIYTEELRRTINLSAELTYPVKELYPFVKWKIIGVDQAETNGITFDKEDGTFDENGLDKFVFSYDEDAKGGVAVDVIAWTDLDNDEEISTIESQSKRKIHIEFVSVTSVDCPKRYFAQSLLDFPFVFSVEQTSAVGITKDKLQSVYITMKCESDTVILNAGSMLGNRVFDGNLIINENDTTVNVFTFLCPESAFENWIIPPNQVKSKTFDPAYGINLLMFFPDETTARFKSFDDTKKVVCLEFGDKYNAMVDIGLSEARSIDIESEEPKEKNMVNNWNAVGFDRTISEGENHETNPNMPPSASRYSSVPWDYALATQTEGAPYKISAQLTSSDEWWWHSLYEKLYYEPKIKRVGYDSVKRGISFNVYCGFKEKGSIKYVDESKSNGSFTFTGFASSNYKLDWRKLPVVSNPTWKWTGSMASIGIDAVEVGRVLIIGGPVPAFWTLLGLTAKEIYCNVEIPPVDKKAAYEVIYYSAFYFTKVSGERMDYYIFPEHPDPDHPDVNLKDGYIVGLVDRVKELGATTGVPPVNEGADLSMVQIPKVLKSYEGGSLFTASHLFLQLATPNKLPTETWIPSNTDGKIILKYNLKNQQVRIKSTYNQQP